MSVVALVSCSLLCLVESTAVRDSQKYQVSLDEKVHDSVEEKEYHGIVSGVANPIFHTLEDQCQCWEQFTEAVKKKGNQAADKAHLGCVFYCEEFNTGTEHRGGYFGCYLGEATIKEANCKIAKKLDVQRCQTIMHNKNKKKHAEAMARAEGPGWGKTLYNMLPSFRSRKGEPDGADIGEWQARGIDEGQSKWRDLSLGERVLRDPAAVAIDETRAEQVEDIIRSAPGPQRPSAVSPRAALLEKVGVLDAMQRAALIARLDAALAESHETEPDAQRDLKLEVADGELSSMIGVDSVQELKAITQEMLLRLRDEGLAGAANARLKFKLRRRAAVEGTQDERIPFHRDNSLVVVNVALNEDFDGASPFFAIGDKLKAPTIAAGKATGHDCTMVHGVSRLASGVRYNLFAVFESM